MMRYWRKSYLSLKYLIILAILFITMITSILIIGYQHNGPLLSLFAEDYSLTYNMQMLSISKYIMLASVAIFFIYIENKSDLGLLVNKGRLCFYSSKYLFFQLFFFILYNLYLLLYLTCSTLFFRYFSLSLEIIRLYYLNYLSVLIYINVSFLLLKNNNQVISILLLGFYIMALQVLIDHSEHLSVYCYLLPFYETNLYTSPLAYLYFMFYNVILFCLFLLKKKYEIITI